MSTHNICFRGEIRKMLTRYPLLSRPMSEVPGSGSRLHSAVDSASDCKSRCCKFES